MRVRLLAGVAAVLALAACTSNQPGGPSGGTTTTSTRTVTMTRTPPPRSYTPAPATSVAPLVQGAPPPAGEVERTCPYIKAGLDQEPTTDPNVADIEGDRVYRTTVLTGRTPVGCRFYFAYAAHEAVADILPTTFATATDAYNAMVRTAEAGAEQIAEPNFVPGVTGICYRTRFFGPDGAQDWAFVFAKGRVLVVVHTQRTDTSRNALYLARALAGRF